jgi:hypothetical protein
MCGADYIEFRLLFQAITFSGVGGIRNLSRSDPAKLSTGFGSQTYIHAVGGSAPLSFVSTVLVGKCHLIDPKTAPNGRSQKLIEGIGIEGEWDRLIGVVGQVINRTQYKAPVEAGYVSFSTTLGNPVSGMSLYL